MMGLFREQGAFSSYSESLLATSCLKKILISSNKTYLQLFPPVLANILLQLFFFYTQIFTHYKCNLSQVIIACNMFLLQYQGTDIYSGLRRYILPFSPGFNIPSSAGFTSKKNYSELFWEIKN